MFKDKKVIAFRDSITEGVLMEPTLKYENTYFAFLSRYLDASSDYTNLKMLILYVVERLLLSVIKMLK